MKIYLEKRIFLLRGPPPRFWPACRSRPNIQPASRAPRLASPRPSPAPRWPASARLLAVAPRRAPDRGRARPPRGGHAPSTSPRIKAGLRTRPRARLHLLVPVRSLSPALPSLSARAERPNSASRRAHAPVGEFHRGSSTSASKHAPAAPPHSPSSRARVCADCRAQVALPQAPPPTAMAPPCSAAMEVTFLLFSSPA